MIPDPLLRAALLDGANDRSAVREVRRVSGGDINLAARVTTERGDYFAKFQRHPPPGFFEAEARGLALLRRADSGLVVPQVVGLAASDAGALLLLPWLAVGRVTPQSAAALGEGLARQHRHIGERYGLDHDNFLGMTPQTNAPDDDWPRFFAAQRLHALGQRLAAKARWPSHRARALEQLCTRLPDLLPHDPPPSLLHGDLWGGNWLALQDGRPALIDPAVSFGDREADLAMTRLFGGFPNAFYDAYAAAWPPEPGAAGRTPLYNLYHLLNHLLLFGEGYGPRVDRVLRRYA